MCILAAINADLNRQLEQKNHHSDETTTIMVPTTTTEVPTTTTTEVPITTTELLTTTTSLVQDESKPIQSNVHGRRRRFA